MLGNGSDGDNGGADGGSMDDDPLMGDDLMDDGLMSDELGGGGDELSFGEEGSDGGSEGVPAELEARVSEIENEVGSLSSTVNTVQSENENIADSLDDIEENIRKLLEVYEMVTQGVNPFIEDDSLTNMFAEGEAARQAPGEGEHFGGESLFDGVDDDAEMMDDDIADVEADEFLDDSFEDDDPLMGDDLAGDDFGDDLEDDGFGDDLEDDGFGDDLEDDGSDESGGDEGLSFDDLKEEYDSGDASWAGDDGSEPGDSEPGSSELDGIESDPVSEQPVVDDGLEADDTSEEPSAVADDDDATSEGEAVDGIDSRPYLVSVPSGYDVEFVVMEWLDYLTDEVGLNGAAQTLRFYESIDWISEPAEAHLQTMLNGFNGGPDLDNPRPNSSLGVEHSRSLWWISQITEPERKSGAFEEWLREADVDLPSVAGRDLSIDVEPVEDTTEADGDDAPSASAGDGDESERTLKIYGDDSEGDSKRDVGSGDTPMQPPTEADPGTATGNERMNWVGDDVETVTEADDTGGTTLYSTKSSRLMSPTTETSGLSQGVVTGGGRVVWIGRYEPETGECEFDLDEGAKPSDDTEYVFHVVNKNSSTRVDPHGSAQ
ncbi:hypothetical protein OB905_02435 [Halobacteria archaeon AArc-dxtr1]|nr:hypothetical protein [Halobacteria archaeon AArc-dxtr1]